jgi:hypothetical protein
MREEGERPPNTLDGEFTESSFAKDSPEKISGFPLTFPGVASFASTGWGRLFLWQAVVIAAITGSCMLLLGQHWAPVLDSAVSQLPEQGGLIEGRLQWPDARSGPLAGNQFLQIIIDPNGDQKHGQLADCQIELRSESWVVGSLLGYMEFPYSLQTFQFNRTKQIPWWGSRRPFLLIGISVSIGLTYGFICLLLGFVGILPSKAVAFFSDRQDGFGSLLRLSTAAWLPSGVLIAATGLCYALNLLPLMGFLIMIPIYCVTGWIYLFISPFFLPRTVPSDRNPFDKEEEQEAPVNEVDSSDSENPFA